MQSKQAVHLNAKAVRFYLNYIRYHRHFEVSAGWDSLANRALDLDDAACDRILDTIVGPLLRASSKTYVYHNSRTIIRPVPKPPVPGWIAKDPSRLTIDVSRTSIDKCRPFWRWTLQGLDGASGNLVLEIPQAQFPRAVIGDNCHDPVLITNLRAAVSPRAVSFCKRAAANADTVYCVFHRDSYHCSISFFGSYRFLSFLYRYCAKHCRFRMKGLEKELRSSGPIRRKKNN